MTEAQPGYLFQCARPVSCSRRPDRAELEHATASCRRNCCAMQSSARTKFGRCSRSATTRFSRPASICARERRSRGAPSFLAGPDHTVQEKLQALTLHTLDLREGSVLERNCVYIVPLQEHLALRYRTSGSANPKSSTGRLNVFARVITDHGAEFDAIRSNYAGPLYAELSPRSFSIRVRSGSRLVQLRIRRGRPTSSNAALRRLHEEIGFDIVPPGAPIRQELLEGGLAVTVDVVGTSRQGFVGYKARKHAPVVDVDLVDHYGIESSGSRSTHGRATASSSTRTIFYILASREAIAIPVDQACRNAGLRYAGR